MEIKLKLFYKHFGGEGTPVVIMHGLFGSHKNWIAVGRALSARGSVYGLDLRNHGESPHADTHTLEDMLEDLDEFIASQLPAQRPSAARATIPATKEPAGERPVLIGHSMGGLAAMAYALSRPDRVAGLVIVDIAPKRYETSHEMHFRALETDVSAFRSRQAIDEALALMLPEPAVRQFIMMNLTFTEDGGYRWRLNVPVLKQAELARARSDPFAAWRDTPWDGPALFVAGGRSEFVSRADFALIRALFPRARIEYNEAADHWLHFTLSDWFIPLAAEFLRQCRRLSEDPR